MTDLEKAARMALEAMGLIGADLVCDAAHHKKADRHGIVEPCPIQARWHHAFAALRQAINNNVEQPAQQEPVAWMWKDGTITTDPDRADGTWAPLYTAPPPRKPWVGLTDEEIGAVCGFAEHTTASTRFALKAISRAVEAKLKEKNT